MADIETLTPKQLEALLKRRRSLRLWTLGALFTERYLAVDRKGRVVATAAMRNSEWIPTPSSIDEARALVREAKEFCAERHGDKLGSHTEMCILNLYGGYTYAELNS